MLGLLMRISGFLAAPTATAGADNRSCSEETKSDDSGEAGADPGDSAGQTTSELKTWSEHHTWRDLEKTAGGRQALEEGADESLCSRRWTGRELPGQRLVLWAWSADSGCRQGGHSGWGPHGRTPHPALIPVNPEPGWPGADSSGDSLLGKRLTETP